MGGIPHRSKENCAMHPMQISRAEGAFTNHGVLEVRL
jgi:hypothetical protein